MISLWQLAASNLLAQEAGCQRFKDGKYDRGSAAPLP